MTKKILLGIGITCFLTILGCSDSEFTSSGCANGNCDDPNVSAQSYNWSEGEFSRCSRACGGGTRTRTVKCLDAQGNTVPDEECGGVKPATSETCNPQACTGSHNWNIGPYGVCSETCGGGLEYRNVNCQANDNPAFVSDDLCPSPKPSETRACNTMACPENIFNWVTGTPGACSKTCGGGTQTVPVTCQNARNEVVDEANCAGLPKPLELVDCNNQSCSYSYNWVPGSYGSCSKTCGGGIQHRSLGCLRDDGVYVPHTLCDASQKPDEYRACNTDPCAAACTNYNISQNLGPEANQLDILLVVDDSNSMFSDNSKLAIKMNSFVNRLQSSNIDWQMCVTSTDVDHFKGRPIQWQGTTAGHILKKDSGDLHSIFVNTIKFIGAGFSNDEQGIKAMNLSVRDNSRSNCYRANAGLAVILISDEDERSVGGRFGSTHPQFKILEPDNTPQSFIDTVKTHFPAGKKLVVNSIIVKDKACQDQQNAQGTDAFFGTLYQDLSNKTGGRVESICSSDFGVNLDAIHTCIADKLSAINLQCTPNDPPSVFVNGQDYTQNTSVSNKVLRFDPVVSGPATVSGSYCCP